MMIEHLDYHVYLNSIFSKEYSHKFYEVRALCMYAMYAMYAMIAKLDIKFGQDNVALLSEIPVCL